MLVRGAIIEAAPNLQCVVIRSGCRNICFVMLELCIDIDILTDMPGPMRFVHRLQYTLSCSAEHLLGILRPPNDPICMAVDDESVCNSLESFPPEYTSRDISDMLGQPQHENK